MLDCGPSVKKRLIYQEKLQIQMLVTDLKLEKRKYYAGQTKHFCRLHLAMCDL